MTTINVTPSLLRGYNTASFAKPDVTAAGSSGAWTTANSPITLFTVTGSVKLFVYAAVGATAVTSTGGTGTLAVGRTGNTNLYIAATTVNGTNLIANAAWGDNSPTAVSWSIAGNALTGVLVNNANIILTIATNNMTAGAVTVYADWVPVSSGATVVAATP